MSQEDDYAAAWRLAVVNRVDLNLIVDYAWPRFLAHASDFVQAVVDDQAVCDLLAALRLDSVAAPGGSYASALPHPNPSTVRFSRYYHNTLYTTHSAWPCGLPDLLLFCHSMLRVQSLINGQC